jgi:hypothetical protein
MLLGRGWGLGAWRRRFFFFGGGNDHTNSSNMARIFSPLLPLPNKNKNPPGKKTAEEDAERGAPSYFLFYLLSIKQKQSL